VTKPTKALERIEYHGLKFDVRVGTSDEKSINEVILRRGYRRKDFEPAEDQEWLDLGANIGAFSIWARSLGAQVTAYEPDPESCEMIEHNLRLNGMHRDVEINQVAVTGHKNRKKAILHQNTARGNVWRNSIEREWRGGTNITVPCLDVRRIWRPDRYIKMDIEGSEMLILETIGSEVAVAGLVFEWSFDVDTSLSRFRRVMANLDTLYGTVAPATIPEGDHWLPEWFPPCRVVWCY
jgi:FkbM family methyltransferase